MTVGKFAVTVALNADARLVIEHGLNSTDVLIQTFVNNKESSFGIEIIDSDSVGLSSAISADVRVVIIG